MENFGKLRKRFKKNFQMFLRLFNFFKNAPWIYALGIYAPGYKSPDISPQDISPRFLAPGYNPPDIGPGYKLPEKKIIVESSRMTVVLINCTAKIPG